MLVSRSAAGSMFQPVKWVFLLLFSLLGFPEETFSWKFSAEIWWIGSTSYVFTRCYKVRTASYVFTRYYKVRTTSYVFARCYKVRTTSYVFPRYYKVRTTSYVFTRYYKVRTASYVFTRYYTVRMEESQSAFFWAIMTGGSELFF